MLRSRGAWLLRFFLSGLFQHLRNTLLLFALFTTVCFLRGSWIRQAPWLVPQPTTCVLVHHTQSPRAEHHWNPSEMSKGLWSEAFVKSACCLYLWSLRQSNATCNLPVSSEFCLCEKNVTPDPWVVFNELQLLRECSGILPLDVKEACACSAQQFDQQRCPFFRWRHTRRFALAELCAVKSTVVKKSSARLSMHTAKQLLNSLQHTEHRSLNTC